jgi:mRNA interferase RelE/StbE
VYKIITRSSVEKDLKKIDKASVKRIIEAIESSLTESPRESGEPLKGKFKGLWKMYVVPYRVIYSVDNRAGTVVIEKIGHRKDVYR